MERSFTTSAIRKRKWREDYPERYRKSNRDNTWKRLGIDVEGANSLRDKVRQCQICGSDYRLHVDHCHTTNKLRGVLCQNCNFGLGNFKDSTVLLTKAIEYLVNV